MKWRCIFLHLRVACVRLEQSTCGSRLLEGFFLWFRVEARKNSQAARGPIGGSVSGNFSSIYAERGARANVQQMHGASHGMEKKRPPLEGGAFHAYDYGRRFATEPCSLGVRGLVSGPVTVFASACTHPR